MGLIYVNLEGLNGNFDLIVLVYDICEIFGCMVMNDEEIVVLIVGGYIFGKIYGVGDFEKYVGVEFVGVSIEEMSIGWKNIFGEGNGEYIIIFGLEGVWIDMLMQWSNKYFENFFKYDWELIKSLVGVYQWQLKGGVGVGIVFDVYNLEKKYVLFMLIIDFVLCMDLVYEKIFCCFYENLDEFVDVFVCVWFKLIYCDMGLKVCYLGLEVFVEELIWQDLVLLVIYKLIEEEDIMKLKCMILVFGFIIL